MCTGVEIALVASLVLAASKVSSTSASSNNIFTNLGGK